MINNLKRYCKAAGSLAINCLLPKRCYNCHAWLKQQLPLCNNCSKSLPYLNGSRCNQCLSELQIKAEQSQHNQLNLAKLNNNAINCGACQQKPPLFNNCIIPFEYSGLVSKMICRFKYHQDLLAGDSLAHLLCREITTNNYLNKIKNINAIVAVPLHKKRLYERGFNQSLILANMLSKKLQVPLLRKSCSRIINTSPQTSLQANKRQHNCVGAFSANEKLLKNKNIILIDDVYTTGSTARELCKVLLKAGCGEITYIALARTG